MNQVQLNTQGLLESIEERLAQIEALVSSAHRTISSYEASLYMQEAAELLQLARELVQEARNCSSSLSAELTTGSRMNALSVFSFQENTPCGWFWLM
ncbi:hypothetical protein [Klebsiella pneumoniae]|uniref:hypothetical protein n=1 Tax=Klebsiella pneumoniae TaxID=573 RepID=UPI001D0D9D89|nr:hypothetical protein [Klebsiella pneumoniae]